MRNLLTIYQELGILERWQSRDSWYQFSKFLVLWLDKSRWRMGQYSSLEMFYVCVHEDCFYLYEWRLLFEERMEKYFVCSWIHMGLINSTVILGDSICKSHVYLWIQFQVLRHPISNCGCFCEQNTSTLWQGVGGGLQRRKNPPARAGWLRQLALLRATSRAEVDVIGVQQC